MNGEPLTPMPELVAKYGDLIGKRYKHPQDGIAYFVGIMWGEDDLYYVMYRREKEPVFVSCVMDIEQCGYVLAEDICP